MLWYSSILVLTLCVSLFLSFIAPATLAIIIQFIAVGNGTCCKLIGCSYIRTAVNFLFSVSSHPFLADGTNIFFTARVQASFYVKFTYIAALTKTIHGSQLHAKPLLCNVLLAKLGFSVHCCFESPTSTQLFVLSASFTRASNIL